MQTFVPLYTYANCARVLDRARLGKQRVEVLQIYNTLTRPTAGPLRGWARHPAVLMWAGHEFALLVYGMYVTREWVSRGYNDTMLENFKSKLDNHPAELAAFNEASPPLPWWWADERIHSSHRASLLMKFPAHYAQFGWTETPAAGYHWPVETPKQ